MQISACKQLGGDWCFKTALPLLSCHRGSPPCAVEPHAALHSMFSRMPCSDHRDTIHSDTILGRCCVHSLEEYNVRGQLFCCTTLTCTPRGHGHSRIHCVGILLDSHLSILRRANRGMFLFKAGPARSSPGEPALPALQKLELVRPQDYFTRFSWSVQTRKFSPEQVTIYCR